MKEDRRSDGPIYTDIVKLSPLPRLTVEQQDALKRMEQKRLKCNSCTFCRWTVKSVGECRRQPPTADGLNTGTHPYTNVSHWCGEHVLIDKEYIV